MNVKKTKIRQHSSNKVHGVICQGCGILVSEADDDTLYEFDNYLWCEFCYERRMNGISYRREEIL